MEKQWRNSGVSFFWASHVLERNRAVIPVDKKKSFSKANMIHMVFQDLWSTFRVAKPLVHVALKLCKLKLYYHVLETFIGLYAGIASGLAELI